MRIEDNAKNVLSTAAQRSQDLLEVAGEMIESTARDEALVDTGFYRGSMFHEVAPKLVRIGAWAEYAPFIEMQYKPVLQIALLANLNNIRRLFHEKSI